MRARFAEFGLLIAGFMASPAQAAGGWMGQDSLHVPASWCIVDQTPAEAAPNIAGDTTTDDLIWRRHERPTDSIYTPQAGITFRSAINDAWTILDFPIIEDPNVTLALEGDMLGSDVNTVAGGQLEFNALVTACDAAYDAIGRAGIGITMVNANLFHDAAGNYITIIGWGGCAELGGNCATPYDGRLVVIDNRYLHPTSPDRTWPDGSGLQFTNTDSMDVLVGHEAGHALSLDHLSVATNLMNPGLTDNSGDNDIDNIALTAAQVTQLRANALNVPGLETDPPGVITPANVVAHRIPDKLRENREIPAHLDLASVRATFDARKNEFGLTSQLGGLLPKAGLPSVFWFVADTGAGGGTDREQLKKLGLAGVDLEGADLVARAEVIGKKIRGKVWTVRDGQLQQISQGFRFDLLTMVLHPLYAQPHKGRMLGPRPVYHLIALKLSNDIARTAGIGGKVRVQAATGNLRTAVADVLDQDGAVFSLERPSFPHCFPVRNPRPGETVDVRLEGFKRPGAPIHGFLGPRLVYRGETDGEGGGTIKLEIPKDTTYGPHLITVGIDKTALTADCIVTVVRQ